MQTAVHGMSPLLIFSTFFGKKGGHLLGNATSLHPMTSPAEAEGGQWIRH
jgi:hypothetical protein